jgi:hypothetical protein
VGASWVRQNILEKHPASPVSVYVVWNSQFGGYRDAIDSAIFDDPRVSSYWDPNGVAGDAIADDVSAVFGSSVYDVYTLYGPDAEWADDAPAPVDWGEPVIAATDRLGQKVQELANA